LWVLAAPALPSTPGLLQSLAMLGLLLALQQLLLPAAHA
jgi:hypothetical protein